MEAATAAEGAPTSRRCNATPLGLILNLRAVDSAVPAKGKLLLQHTWFFDRLSSVCLPLGPRPSLRAAPSPGTALKIDLVNRVRRSKMLMRTLSPFSCFGVRRRPMLTPGEGWGEGDLERRKLLVTPKGVHRGTRVLLRSKSPSPQPSPGIPGEGVARRDGRAPPSPSLLPAYHVLDDRCRCGCP